MRKIVSMLAAGLFLLFCAAVPSLSFAAPAANILIIGEDPEDGTVPRNSPGFKHVVDALIKRLHDKGFNVFDETAVVPGDVAEGHGQRSDAEIIDIARSFEDPPIDVAVVFSIYAKSKHKFYANRVYARMPGRLLNVETGEVVGDFDVVPLMAYGAPIPCERRCILKVVDKNAKKLAKDLGAVLTEQLPSASH